VAGEQALASVEAPGGEPRCLNCGEVAAGKFCSECGQGTRLPAATLWAFIAHSLINAFKVDGKTISTLRALFTRPGFLTREFWQGRRMSYTEPRRLFLFASLVFFAVYAYAPITSLVDVKVERSKVTITDDAPWIVRRGAALASLSRDELLSRAHAAFQEQMPKISLVLLPVFALLLQLVLRGARRPYLEHLTFSFHVHSFAFLAMVPGLLLSWATPKPKLIGFTIIGVYIFLSMWKAYRFGFWSSLARYLVINAIYSSIVGLSFLALLFWKV
jgi:hypothetical protein